MFGYLILGYSVGSWIKSGEKLTLPHVSYYSPWWEVALRLALPAGILILPFIAFVQARKKGAFLGLNTWQWVAMPLGSLVVGGVLSIRY